MQNNHSIVPCEAAERISVRRIAARERGRTTADLMEPMPTIMVEAAF